VIALLRQGNNGHKINKITKDNIMENKLYQFTEKQRDEQLTMALKNVKPRTAPKKTRWQKQNNIKGK
jgi:hypothetical protein